MEVAQKVDVPGFSKCLAIIFSAYRVIIAYFIELFKLSAGNLLIIYICFNVCTLSPCVVRLAAKKMEFNNVLQHNQ